MGYQYFSERKQRPENLGKCGVRWFQWANENDFFPTETGVYHLKFVS